MGTCPRLAPILIKYQAVGFVGGGKSSEPDARGFQPWICHFPPA